MEHSDVIAITASDRLPYETKRLEPMKKMELKEIHSLAIFAYYKTGLLNEASFLKVIDPVKTCILRVEGNMRSYPALFNLTETGCWHLEIVNVLLQGVRHDSRQRLTVSACSFPCPEMKISPLLLSLK